MQACLPGAEERDNGGTALWEGFASELESTWELDRCGDLYNTVSIRTMPYLS